MEKTNRTIEFFKNQIGKENLKTPSPAGNWLGGIVREIEFGSITADFTIRPEMINPHNTLHGGIISLMFDDVFGATIFCLERETPFVTVNLNVDFLSIAKLNDVVTVKTKVKRNGKTVINIDGELYKGERLIATASSILVSTGITTSSKN